MHVKGLMLDALEYCHKNMVSDERYKALLQSNINLEYILSLKESGRAQEFNISAVSHLSKIRQLINQRSYVDPLSSIMAAIILSHQNHENSLQLIEVALDMADEFGKDISGVIRAWAYYARAVTKISISIIEFEYSDYIKYKYIVDPEGRAESNRLVYKQLLISGASEDIKTSRSYQSGFVSLQLSSMTARQSLVIKILSGKCDQDIGRDIDYQNSSLAELHTYCTYLSRSGNIELVRKIVTEASVRLNEWIIEVLPGISIKDIRERKDIESNTIYASGHQVISQKRIHNKLITRTEASYAYAAIESHSITSIRVLDLRGMISTGDNLVVWQTVDLYDNDHVLLLSIINGDWTIMPNQWCSAIVSKSNDLIITITKKHNPISLKTDGIVLLMADIIPTMANYFHWMLDGLPRILSIFLQNSGNNPSVLFLKKPSPLMMETMISVGIPNEKIFFCEPAGYPIFINQACMSIATLPGIYRNADTLSLNPHLIRFIRSFIFSDVHVSRRTSRKIYVSRSNRGPNNSSEVCNLLSSRGFEEVVLDGKSYAYQKELFFDVDVLVTPIGATLTNMIFMRTGTTVISLANEHYDVACFGQLASIIGINYITVVCKSDVVNKEISSLNYFVDCADLNIALEQAQYDNDNSLV